jgi:hypothetical protein
MIPKGVQNASCGQTFSFRSRAERSMFERHILAVLLAYASSSDAAETRRAVPGVEQPRASVAELEWLAGAWEGSGLLGPAREVYSPMTGGAIVGHFVQQSGDEIRFYELMLIRQDGNSLTYCVKHFNADLSGWEEKNEVQCFPLVARRRNAYYFDGLTIHRDGDDRMISTVRVDTPDGEHELVFHYRRVD